MYKLLKWAYNLGAKQENMRIRHEIDNLSAKLQAERQGFNTGSRNLDDEKQAEKLQRQKELNYAVQGVLDNLIQPKGEWVTTGTAPIDQGTN